MQDTKKEVDEMKNTMKKPVAIPVEKLHPFDGHPFKVKDDDEMNTLIESIQTQGVLSPLIVRPIENTDEYEVVSGHRRLHAAQKAGITEVPALIYALDRDAAAIAVLVLTYRPLIKKFCIFLFGREFTGFETYPLIFIASSSYSTGISPFAKSLPNTE